MNVFRQKRGQSDLLFRRYRKIKLKEAQGKKRAWWADLYVYFQNTSLQEGAGVSSANWRQVLNNG